MNMQNLDEARAQIKQMIDKGCEYIAAETITYYGLEHEYPEIIAKVDREREMMRA